MNPIKVWVIVDDQGKTTRCATGFDEITAWESFTGIPYDVDDENTMNRLLTTVQNFKKVGYTCKEMYLAPIEPSEDMNKRGESYLTAGMYNSDIQSKDFYTAMMESRDE